MSTVPEKFNKLGRGIRLEIHNRAPNLLVNYQNNAPTPQFEFSLRHIVFKELVPGNWPLNRRCIYPRYFKVFEMCNTCRTRRNVIYASMLSRIYGAISNGHSSRFLLSSSEPCTFL